jgi:hypothetical protein
VIATAEIIAGVRMRPEEVEAEFVTGSAQELARGIRDLLWSDMSLFEDADLLIVHVGGDRPESREDPLEVESRRPGIPYETITLSPEIFTQLLDVRERNMPGPQYALWFCECEEYCDQDHGEDRLDLFVCRPSFHELAVSQADS